MGRRKDCAVIGDREELALLRQIREVERIGRLRDHHPRVMAGLKGITESAGGAQVKLRDYAEDRRAELERAFHNVGLLVGTAIPMPIGTDGKPISNHEFERRKLAAIPQALFVQPPQSLWTPKAHMTAFGQGGHWTLKDAEQTKIALEPVDYWRWFWFDIADDCPRLGTSLNKLIKTIRLPSIEEYEIGWHLHKAITGKMLDVRFWTWLRTRYNTGALKAGEYYGKVNVYCRDAESLAKPWSSIGGRVAEMVKKIAA